MAKRGLVSAATPVNADSEVRLTPEGRQAVVEIIAIHKASEAQVLEGFDPSEVQLLKQLLRRLGEDEVLARRQTQTKDTGSSGW